MLKAIFFDLGDTLIHEKVDDLTTLCKMELHLRVHAREVLEVLSRLYSIILVSDTETSAETHVRDALTALGIERFFTGIVTSVDVGARKPDSAIFQAALDKVAASTSEVIMVGNDPDRDIVGAKQMGIRTVLFRQTKYYRAGAEELSDFCIDSLMDLLGIVRAVDSRAAVMKEIDRVLPGETDSYRDPQKGEVSGTAEDREQNKANDIRTGYSAAVQMAVYDGQLSWSVTGIYVQVAILIIAGAVFPSFTGSKDKLVLALAGLLISLAGIILSSMFLSMVSRIRTYEGHWVAMATKLERDLNATVDTFAGARNLSRGDTLNVDGQILRMRRLCAIKSQHMLVALFLLFLVIYAFLFVLNAFRVIEAWPPDMWG